MNLKKVFLVLSREYNIRVKKKTFLLMTFLVPLLLVGVMVLPVLLSKKLQTEKLVQIIDESGIFEGKLQNIPKLANFEFSRVKIEDAKKNLQKENNKFHAVLHIPKDIASSTPKDSQTSAKKLEIYSEKGISLELQASLSQYVSQTLEVIKLQKAGINAKEIMGLQTSIEIETRSPDEKNNDSTAATAIGFVLAFIIYFAIFFFGSQIMLGIIEEKNNRIVEVIISSLKPIELMMGKIIGVALVAITQFLIWIVVMVTVTNLVFGSGTDAGVASNITGITDILWQQNWVLILGTFLFYFLGGYFIYSAMFAAAASAVDNQADAQQFTLPITIPLIISFIFVQGILTDPHGSLALTLSMIPLTSPIIMVIRIPFGVPIWELLLSMTLLMAGFIFMTWIAARIYRVGIFMYGKKPSFKDLGKWIFYK